MNPNRVCAIGAVMSVQIHNVEIDWFEKFFRIYDYRPPGIVTQSMGYLVLLWVAILCISLLISTVFLARPASKVIPRVIVLMGGLFKEPDGKHFRILHRFVTCTILHFHFPHVISNALSVAGNYVFWKRSCDGSPGSFDLYYFMFPTWLFGAILGSYWSYATSLKKATFTMGASGGGCAYVAFIIVMTLTKSDLTSKEASSVAAMIATGLIQVAPVGTLSLGVENTDQSAHAGGALAGIAAGSLVRYLHNNWESPDIRYLGAIFTVVSWSIIILAYIALLIDNLRGYSLTVTKLYIKLIKLDALELKRTDDRRWSVGNPLTADRYLNVEAPPAPQQKNIFEDSSVEHRYKSI